MADILAPDPRPAPAGPREPVPAGFRELMAALVTEGTEASDRDDEPGFRRAFAFRAAIKRIADRWTAGEASPVRTAAAKKEP